MFRLSSAQERTSIRRRELLMDGFAAAVSCAFPLVSHAATALVLPTPAADRRFSVKYKGIKIGTHAVSYSSLTGETRVKTQITHAGLITQRRRSRHLIYPYALNIR